MPKKQNATRACRSRVPCVLLSIYFVFFSCSAQAFNLGATAGFYQMMLGHLQETNSSRNDSLFGDPRISVFLETEPFRFIGQTTYVPELAVVFFSTPTANTTHQYSLNNDFAGRLFSQFYLHYGLGLNLLYVSGSGGAVTRGNGGGTAIYYQPSDSSTTLVTTLNLGLYLRAYESEKFTLGAKAQTYWVGLLNNAARQINVGVSIVATFL